MKNRFVIGYYNLANFVTILGLLCSLLSCFLIEQGHYTLAMVAFSSAGLCDMMDGRIARANPAAGKRVRYYGVQLDSLCDVVSFGVVPCFMAYWLGYNGTFDILIYLLFAFCGATRLANFNMEVALDSPNLKSNKFTGVPIPFTVPVFPLLLIIHLLVGHPVYWLFRLVLVLIAIGFILRIRIPKPTGRTQLILVVYQLIVLLALLITSLNV